MILSSLLGKLIFFISFTTDDKDRATRGGTIQDVDKKISVPALIKVTRLAAFERRGKVESLIFRLTTRMQTEPTLLIIYFCVEAIFRFDSLSSQWANRKKISST